MALGQCSWRLNPGRGSIVGGEWRGQPLVVRFRVEDSTWQQLQGDLLHPQLVTVPECAGLYRRDVRARGPQLHEGLGFIVRARGPQLHEGRACWARAGAAPQGASCTAHTALVALHTLHPAPLLRVCAALGQQVLCGHAMRRRWRLRPRQPVADAQHFHLAAMTVFAGENAPLGCRDPCA